MTMLAVHVAFLATVESWAAMLDFWLLNNKVYSLHLFGMSEIACRIHNTELLIFCDLESMPFVIKWRLLNCKRVMGWLCNEELTRCSMNRRHRWSVHKLINVTVRVRVWVIECVMNCMFVELYCR